MPPDIPKDWNRQRKKKHFSHFVGSSYEKAGEKRSMNPGEPEKLDLRSHDIVEDKKAELFHLFPEIRTETGKIDFDRLKLVLGETVDVGKERFGMNWPGKADCFKAIQTPSMGTLLPCPEESVNFDTTENLIIEGDNLEVLKLLQKSYLGKIKMIYIDPPYNTGNDFIYPDNYTESLQTYLQYTGQVDDEGKRFTTNTEADGRFHSKWLNMMYPRLYLARNLLREHGILFASIDDTEVSNLRHLMDDIFGSQNFLGCISVVSNLKGRSDDKYFATAHNYLLAYSRGDFVTRGVPLPEEYWDDYPEIDSEGKHYRLIGLRKRGAGARRQDRPNMFFPVYVDPHTCKVSLDNDSLFTAKVEPKLSDGSDGRWRWGKETVRDRIQELIGAQVGSARRWDIFQIDYAENEEGVKRIKPKTFWIGP
ncbi:MAG: site-specific DNA-methyltransferase, partial [Desulfomonilaceae bacterium]|nr:site-specific DNA-methyltransferase [Desulfomonilaceae bacterium]